jgi:uncharacterized membrane protein YqjE
LGFGVLEILILIALVISMIWVFFDAPKYGINKYIAVLAILVLIYPIGFIGYLIVTRILRKIK